MGQSVVKNPKKLYSQLGGDPTLPSRVTNLENNEYKVTYYEVISGTSGSLTVPSQATINAGEFGLSGNAILSKIDGSNKPTFQSPTTSGGVVVTASLNTTTGAWTASGTYTDANVALIYSIKIKAVNYSNLDYDFIIETVADGSAYIKNLTSDAQTQLNNKGNSRPIYSGKWRSIPYVGMPGNSTGNQGNVWYIPYIVDSTHIVTDIGLEVTAAIAATNIRLALYNDNNGVPGSLIEESASISSASTGLKTHTFGTPKTLSASNQIYWMAFQCSAFAVGLRATATAVNNLYITGIGAIGSVYSQSQAFGAFPANATPVNFSSSSSWLLSLKVQ